MAGKESGKRSMAVGIKQARKALLAGEALEVFLAQDADQSLVEPLRELAESLKIPHTAVPGMRELGKRCGIQVPTAAAALLKG